MRTFIAIDLSNETKEKLKLIQAELKRSDADVKWVDPENIHLTLKFLGEITEEQAGRIKETLNKIASNLKPFEITLSGIGAFPKLDYPRVIWVGIEKGKKETEEIAKRTEDELEKLGIEKEERAFTAHLTIGRVRSGRNKDALKDRVNSLNLQPTTYHLLPTNVNAIYLYQSTLTPKGPTYTPLHTAAFQESTEKKI